MKNINAHDKNLLILIFEALIAFEKKKTELNSLVSSLEISLSSMESVEESWEQKFLKEVTALETVNALRAINEAGEDINEISIDESNRVINNSVKNLKELVEMEIL